MSATEIILIFAVGFIALAVLIALVVGGYYLYRYETDQPDRSIDFSPGDTISFRPAFSSTFIGDFNKNETLYTVSGPEISSVENCPRDDVGSSDPTNIPCNQTAWLYDTDKSLRPIYDKTKYIYRPDNDPGLCPRENLQIGGPSDGPPIKWEFDRSAATWCVIDGKYKGQCMQTPGYAPNLQGTTLSDLPSDFDTLTSSDFRRVSFQWVVTVPLTNKGSPRCAG